MTLARWLALAPLLLAAGCASRPVPVAMLDCVGGPQPPDVEMAMVIDGVRRVLPRDFDRYYPERAIRLKISGSAVIDCSARTGSGKCRAVSADPADSGFDAAAERMSLVLRAAPGVNEPLTQGEIRIEFRFFKSYPDPCANF